jgi:pSer/pThr/pTyr-binding forkhead associated (FHA) protein
VLIERGQPGRRIPLTRDRMVVGRQEGSDVMLADAGASRRHAELRHDGDRWIITDLGSTNGTLVNERAVGERALEEGDRITIGRTVLEFRGG